MAVSRACKVGRLNKCVERDATGRVVGITSVELADEEWRANSDYTDAPQHDQESHDGENLELGADGSPQLTAGMNQNQVKTVQAYWDAQTRRLKFEQAAGTLVEAAGVEKQLRDVFTQCKVKLLGIPTQAIQRLPHLSTSDVAVIEELIREALTALAEEAKQGAQS